MGSWLAQTKLLMWRNWLVKKRHPFSTLSEILIPIAFVCLVVWLQTLDPDVAMDEGTYTCPRQSPVSPTIFTPTSPNSHRSFVFEIITSGFGPGIQTIPPLFYLSLLACKIEAVIALAPKDNDPKKSQWLLDFQRRMDSVSAGFDDAAWMGVSRATGIGFCRFGKISKIYKSESELLDYVTSEQYGRSTWDNDDSCPNASGIEHPKIHLALILNSLGDEHSGIDYSIQSNISSVPRTYPELGLTNHLVNGVNTRWLDMYVKSGFLTLQHAVDRFIVDKTTADSDKIRNLSIRQICDMIVPAFPYFREIISKKDDFPFMLQTVVNMVVAEAHNSSLDSIEDIETVLKYVHDHCPQLVKKTMQFLDLDIEPFMASASMIPNNIRMTEFPTPKYIDRPFYLKIKNVFGLDLVLTFLWPISRLIRGIVTEKESRLREGLRVMGLRYVSLYLSWFLTYGILFSVIALSITAISSVGLFSRSDPFLVFSYFFLFGTSIIAYCFLVSVLFSRAKTASIAGIVMFFMAFFPYFGVNRENATRWSKQMTSTLSPTMFGLGATVLATYEASGEGVSFENMWDTPNDTQVSFFFILTALATDTLIYILIGFYLDAVVPQEFGVAKPWNFFCRRSYWRKNLRAKRWKADSLLSDELATLNSCDSFNDSDSAFIQPLSAEMSQLQAEDHCIRIQALNKIFEGASGQRNRVLKNLNLSMFEGQIFALLGHNGAGKTTTMNILTGMIPKSSGQVSLCGMDIESSIDEIRQSIGVCPQHDILFSDLTVWEHLQLFCSLKRVQSIDSEAEKYIRMVGLAESRNVLVRNLSGGQKRKLSVAIALLGDSKIIFLDEPSSGMDPHSRRVIWDVLRNNRDGRIIILTTHFMDEANVLGDRIGILASGALKCCGTSHFLKEKYGVGYSLTFSMNQEHEMHNVSSSGILVHHQPLIDKIQQTFPKAEVTSNIGAEVSVKIPFSASSKFGSFFQDVDSSKVALGVADYNIGINTIAEVFLKVASDEYSKDEPREIFNNADNERDSTMEIHSGFTDPPEVSNSGYRESIFSQHSKPKIFYTQVRALIRKRYQYAKRDRRSLCCTTLLPILLIVLGLSIMKMFPIRSAPVLPLDLDQFEQELNYLPVNTSDSSFMPLDFEDSSSPSLKPISAVINPANNTCDFDQHDDDIPDGSHIRGLSDWVLEHGHANRSTIYGAAQFGELSDDYVEATILLNSSAIHGPPIYMNIINRALSRWFSAGKLNSSIHVSSHPFPFTSGQSAVVDILTSVNASMTMIVAFGFIAASVAIFVVKEREINAKHQQLISGVGIVAYWFSNYVWDMFMYMFTWSAAVLIVFAFQLEELSGNALLAFVVLFLLYGFAIMPFTYLVSFFFKSHSTAQNVVLLVNFITGQVLLIASFVMSAIESTQELDRKLKYFYRIFPSFSVANGLLQVTIRSGVKRFLPESESKYGSFDWDISGAEITYLACTSALYFVLVLILDYLYCYPTFGAFLEKVFNKMIDKRNRAFKKLSSFGKRLFSWNESHTHVVGENTSPLLNVDIRVEDEWMSDRLSEGIDDPDVAVERDRVNGVDDSAMESDLIVLKHLKKVYADGKVAVKGLSFGVSQGECFGFLGVNGAGKSSTLKMLTGDILPTSGTALLSGNDIVTQQSNLRKTFGYCPQFSPLLEHLTVREHLELYGRIRGIRDDILTVLVDEKIMQLSLRDQQDKTAGMLSGGNQRKLCVAIALIGSPPLIFLDEPSTGMDLFSKRFLWKVLVELSSNSSIGTVILTSHSMEEVEALCSRVGIMVDGQLRCLGNISHLKARFGKGLIVSLCLANDGLDDFDSEMIKKVSDLLVTEEDHEVIFESSLRDVCIAWGNENRFRDIYLGKSALRSSISRYGKVSVHYLAGWWRTQDAFAKIDDFFNAKFPQSILSERLDTQVTYLMPKHALGEVFRILEDNKKDLNVEQYSVADSSLESIFNSFAKTYEDSESFNGERNSNLA